MSAKVYFDKENLKLELWGALSSVEDERVLEDLNVTVREATTQFFDKKQRFRQTISNLTTIVGLSFTIVIALTFHIVATKEILLRVESGGFFLGVAGLLWVLGYLIVVPRPKTAYTEIKETSLLRFGAGQDYKDFLKNKIFTLSYSSAANSFALEAFKNKFKKVYWVLLISLVLTILFGALMIAGIPDKTNNDHSAKSPPLIHGSSDVRCMTIDSPLCKVTNDETQNRRENHTW
jgi:hypothetical protein